MRCQERVVFTGSKSEREGLIVREEQRKKKKRKEQTEREEEKTRERETKEKELNDWGLGSLDKLLQGIFTEMRLTL